MELKPGTLLQGGKYEVRNTLGNGGFGITYLAEHHMLNKLVCIKEFFPREYYNRDQNSRSISLGSQGSASLMAAYRNKFVKEARTIARLQHPNVISIYDVFEENNTAYYVMEYIEGDTLQGMVKRNGVMDVNTAKQYIMKVASALEYIHGNNLLHLDVKPANIMVSRADGRVVLIDFGLSKQYDKDGNQTSATPVGVSPGYAPPEQYEMGVNTNFSPATDIYALGATLYYITTGLVPPSSSVVMDGCMTELVQHLPVDIQRVILQCMQPSRRMRPSNIAAFVGLFQDARTLVDVNENAPHPHPLPQHQHQHQHQPHQQPQPHIYAQRMQQRPVHPYPKPNSWLTMSILATIFCCLPFGIIGIVKASKVNNLWNAGRYSEARECASSARNWTILSMVLALLLPIICVLGIFFFGVMASEEEMYDDEYYYEDEYYYDDYYSEQNSVNKISCNSECSELKYADYV